MKKQPGHWRIMIGNINSFPLRSNKQNQYKMEMLRTLTVGNCSDIILISEHNRNIKRLQHEDKPAEIVRRWWPRTVTRYSYLESNNRSTFEPGGTMIITNEQATAHTCKSGEDKQMLGRWNYITIRGKHEHYTTIISVYRPATTQETYMRQTALSAKRRSNLPSYITPDELWYSDLQDLIIEKKNDGHEIIVAGDFNDDLNKDTGATVTFMRNLGLKEIMLDALQGPGPPTYARGTTTIDGIFASDGIIMAQGKYTSFHQSPSDHRWITIDISERSILGIQRYDRCTAISRKVTAKMPSVKENYQRLLEQQVTKHNLGQKMEYLYQQAISNRRLNEDEEQIYEQIEQRMQRAVQYADKRCRKIRRGQISYSPEQKRLMGAITVLKQIKLRYLLRRQKNRPRSKRIRRLIRKYDYKGPSTFETLEQLDLELQVAYKQYNDFKTSAQTKRWTYLENIAREYDEIDGKGRQHHYKILLRNEQTKEYYRRIRFCEGKNKGGGVDKIQMEMDGNTVTTYDKELIEQEIMRVNQEKLLQAQDTPLRDYRIAQLLGEQGDFSIWESILRGTIRLPEDIDEGLELWYKFVTTEDHHELCDFVWTTEEYCMSWNKMKEDKTTLPGIQVAHLKCLDPNTSSADIMSKLSLIPLLTGYSPSTWRRGIDSMIPKKVADLRPEKLRLILLMDARFNHNNKLIGKNMMEYGERYNLLAPEQYGSRKNKSAIDHATNKRVTMDILRQSKTPAIYIANDAKSCYDRIILLVAYLTMRNFGIPATVAQSTISTILNMQHYVRTSYGDSTTYYGGDKWEIKPHGCGQGNGYGPALWACISSPLLHILRQQGYGTKIHTPLSQTFIHMAAFSFVDDTDIIQTGSSGSEKDPEQIVSQLYSSTQNALNTWASILAATGGALEPTKTFYVPMIPEWKGNKANLKRMDHRHNLHLRDSNQEYTVLPQKDPNHSFFSLGIWQSPTGDETHQLQYLQSIINAWGSKTSTNKLPWNLARIAVKSTVGRSLSYSLAATAFTEQQCKILQRYILNETLGKMGIVRTASSIIAVAPTTLGGFGIISVEISQLSQHIAFLLQHGPTVESNTGKLLRSTLEYNALETGYPGDPLCIPLVTYTTPQTWISNTLHFMAKYNIQIRSDITGLESWISQDTYIMEQLNDYGTVNTLRTINKVRLYLRVVTFSDLITSDGKHFDKNLIQGMRSTGNPNPSFYRYLWPDVPSPSKAEQAIWQAALVFSFKINVDRLQTDRQMISWNPKALQYAKWIYCSTTHILYHQEQKCQWSTWRPSQESRHHRTRLSSHIYCRTTQTLIELPMADKLASVRRQGENTVVLISMDGCTSTTTCTTCETHATFYIPYNRAVTKYQYNIVMHQGMIFTDGSYENGHSAFAWVAQPEPFTGNLTDIDFTTILCHSDMVDGSNEDQNSYRAELGGILNAIERTNQICNQAGIRTGACTLYCDSKGALCAAFGHKRPTPRWSSFDLVRRIREAIRKSPIGWRYRHVKGHQDDSRKFQELDVDAQGNVLVDYLASRKLRERMTAELTHLPSQEPWMLFIAGKQICGNVDKRLHIEIFKPLMRAKWTSIFRLDEQQAARCEWSIFFRSLNNFPSHRLITLIKYNARLLPVGVNLKRRRHAMTSTCEYCQTEETHEHLISCNHPDVETVFADILHEVHTWLLLHTSASIAEDIIAVTQTFRQGSDHRSVAEHPSDRVRDQVLLGPSAFFAGLWTECWIRDHRQHYTDIKSRKDPSTWLTRIINRIQTIPLEMWAIRNKIRHTNGNSQERQRQNDELNSEIDRIFEKKPHDRLMAHCDIRFFRKHTKESVKSMKIHRKTNWISGANLILLKYQRNTTTQSERFTSYFQWDRG